MQDIEKVLISKEQLQKRIEAIAQDISVDFKGEEVLFVCILRGSAIFFADLIRKVKDCDVKIDFMAISSYGAGATSSGEVKMIKDLNTRIEGMNVIVVEDIIDSGRTLKYLKQLLWARNPKDLKICTLLDKPLRREVELEGDYVGFTIPNEFVVGYGLDYAERYRNLEEVCVLAPSVYESK
ncbi:MAG: hypoxanthine phosphoribosyltransferase [Clostridia bacterium]